LYSSALTGLLGDFILGRILSSAVVILANGITKRIAISTDVITLFINLGSLSQLSFKIQLKLNQVRHEVYIFLN
jgi:hypothetical protein